MEICRPLFITILHVYVASTAQGFWPKVYHSLPVSTKCPQINPFLSKKEASVFVYSIRTKRHVDCTQIATQPVNCDNEHSCECYKVHCKSESVRQAQCADIHCPPGQECFLQVPCPEHYETSCTATEECEVNQCYNGGTCLSYTASTDGQYKCICDRGWTGNFCETATDECEVNQCDNGGTCLSYTASTDGQYKCSCGPGWTGNFCESDIDECASNPCQNGGTCNNLQNRYTCTCSEDFIGTNCENDTCDSTQQTGADIVFVVDSSASQTQDLFEKQKDYMKTFISNFPIGPNDFQVAVVSYAFSTTIHCHLNTYSTETDLHSAIDQMVYVSGASYTGSALRTVREEVLTTASGMRSSLNRYIIALTDGMSSDITDTQSQADQLKLGGATLLAVAFGPQIYHPELLDIASDSRKVFPSSMQDPVFTILRNHLPVCPDCFRNTSDVGILFDASTNLSPAQFYPAIDALITLIEELPIGPSNVHVSYIKYAQDVYDEFDFNQYQTTGEVVKVIVTSLKQYTGPGNLTRALDHMTYNGFHDNRGARSDARKFAIVFTQGNFDDFDSVQTSADTLKNSGVTLALVGIGTESNTNLTSLLGLASDPAFAFVVGEEFNISDQVLRSMASSVEFDVCEFD